MKYQRARKNNLQISDLSYVLQRQIMSHYVINQADLIEAMTLALCGCAMLNLSPDSGARFGGLQFAKRPGLSDQIKEFEAETLQELSNVLGLFMEESKAA